MQPLRLVYGDSGYEPRPSPVLKPLGAAQHCVSSFLCGSVWSLVEAAGSTLLALLSLAIIYLACDYALSIHSKLHSFFT